MPTWYENKLKKDFDNCKTKDEADKLLENYNWWNNAIDRTLTVGGGVGTLGLYLGLLATGHYFPNMDKIGHTGKGLLTSRATGSMFNKIYQRIHPVKDSDDETIANLKSFWPRLLTETLTTIGSALGWEYAQATIPEFPGGDFSFYDAGADTLGHGIASTIEALLQDRRAKQLAAYNQKLKELKKKPVKVAHRAGFMGVTPSYLPHLAEA